MGQILVASNGTLSVEVFSKHSHQRKKNPLITPLFWRAQTEVVGICDL